MSRLALAVLLVFGASAGPYAQTAAPPKANAPASPAAPAPDPFPTEKQALTSVRGYVVNYCQQAPAQCAEAQSVLAGYEKALQGVAACRAKPCAESVLFALSSDIAALDARAGAMAFFPATGHPLLALSVMASARLSVLAAEVKTRDGKPALLDQVDPFTPQGAAKAVEKKCAEAPDACPVLRELYTTGIDLYNQNGACQKTPCSFETVDSIVVRGGTAVATFLSQGKDVLELFALLNDTNKAALKELSQIVDQRLKDLSGAADKFSARLDGLEKDGTADPQALRRDSDALFGRFRDVSVGEDRINYYLGYDKAAKRPEINAAAGRLAGLRSRALAAMSARALTLPMPAADSAAPGGAGPAQIAYKAAQTDPAAAPPKPTLLDARAVPNPSGPGVPAADPAAPPIVPGSPSTLDLLKRLRSADPMQSADAKRRLGLTKTYGSPGIYAAQAFEQEAPNTCAVASQVQVLRAHGLLPSNADPQAQEKRLAALAKARGYMDKGTPAAYDGELLIDYGLLVSKKEKASWEDLEAVLKRGHAAQIGVDARYLWPNQDPTKPLPHAILAVGLETDRIGGQVLGVYVNDSGSIVPGAARFEPIAKFKQAWSGDYAEIQ